MGRRKPTPGDLPDQRWTAASAPAPVAPDDTDPVAAALPAAERHGHKVGRAKFHLFCWHCDATGMVLESGADGTIFTTKCNL